MSVKRICDICNKNEASRSFRIQISNVNKFGKWGPYKEIDICGECAEKILGMRYIDSSGLPRAPKERCVFENCSK